MMGRGIRMWPRVGAVEVFISTKLGCNFHPMRLSAKFRDNYQQGTNVDFSANVMCYIVVLHRWQGL